MQVCSFHFFWTFTFSRGSRSVKLVTTSHCYLVNWQVLGIIFLRGIMDFSHSHECSLFSNISVLRDFVLVLWVWDREPETLLPNSQKNKKTKTKLQPLSETWVAVLAGDMNCLLRCPRTVWSIDSSGWGTISPPKLTPFLEKCRGHGGQSKKQSELVLRNIFYSWE